MLFPLISVMFVCFSLYCEKMEYFVPTFNGYMVAPLYDNIQILDSHSLWGWGNRDTLVKILTNCFGHLGKKRRLCIFSRLSKKDKHLEIKLWSKVERNSPYPKIILGKCVPVHFVTICSWDMFEKFNKSWPHSCAFQVQSGSCCLLQYILCCLLNLNVMMDVFDLKTKFCLMRWII